MSPDYWLAIYHSRASCLLTGCLYKKQIVFLYFHSQYLIQSEQVWVNMTDFTKRYCLNIHHFFAHLKKKKKKNRQHLFIQINLSNTSLASHFISKYIKDTISNQYKSRLLSYDKRCIDSAVSSTLHVTLSVDLSIKILTPKCWTGALINLTQLNYSILMSLLNRKQLPAPITKM